MSEIAIKTEPLSDNFVFIEDNIKIEEPVVQESEQDCGYVRSGLDLSVKGPRGVMVEVEEEFSVCSKCQGAFKRSVNVKLRHGDDLTKCNKCILHSKLKQVFNRPLPASFIKNNDNFVKKDDNKQRVKRKKLKVVDGKEKQELKHKKICCNKNTVEDSVVIKTEDNDDVVIITVDRNIKTESVRIKKKMFMCVQCKKTFERNNPVKLHDDSDWYKCNTCILRSRLSSVFSNSKKHNKTQDTSIS